MKNSDIIFWSSIFFVVSWLMGYYLGIEAMLWSWLLWLIMFITFGFGFLYYKMLQKRFD